MQKEASKIEESPKKRKRTISKERQELSGRGNKTLYLPSSESEYQSVIDNATAYRAWVDNHYEQFPQLFPSAMSSGYRLHDIRLSKKQEDLPRRRIKLKSTGACYTIQPSFMLPYMVGTTEEAAKALFLRKHGLSYDGITYILGKDDMYWQRIELSLSRMNIVGTTLQDSSNLPKDIASDEKHTKHLGEKSYACITATADCILGASISQKADTEGLKEAYEEFKQDSQAIDPTYEPNTNNRDGWEAGLAAFGELFPLTVSILCFLHEWLKIQNRCRKLKKVYKDGLSLMTHIGNKVWEIYQSESKEAFEAGVQELRDWVNEHITEEYLQKQIYKFCDRADTLATAYQHKGCLRTSNAVDRPMKQLNKVLRNMQYFHGHLYQANRFLRAWALIHNFAPYTKKVQKQTGLISPAHKVNGFCYHENWLQNLLISGSLNGGSDRLRAIPHN